ncbi:MAG: KGK domain-containing protein, partial [Chroococcales cyanobacterium]
MDNKFEPLNSGEVISVDDSVQFLIGHKTFQAGEFASALKKQLIEYGIGGLTGDKLDWLSEEGIPCQVLKFGSQGWQKGMVRISLEFCFSDEATEMATQEKSQPEAATQPTQPTAEKPQPETVVTETITSTEVEAELDFGKTPEVTAEEEGFDLDLGQETALESFDETLAMEETPELELDEAEETTSEETFDLGESFEESDELDLGEVEETTS